MGRIELTTTAEAAVEESVRAHARLVWRIAYLVLKDGAEAEEVAQEVFLRAWRQRARWHQVERPAAWLARVTWRLAVDRQRQVRRRRGSASDALDTLDLPAAEAGAERTAAGRELLAVVTALIAALPRRLREPLLLASLEELTSREIAAILRVPEGSVRSRILQARLMLRKRLAARLTPRTTEKRASV